MELSLHTSFTGTVLASPTRDIPGSASSRRAGRAPRRDQPRSERCDDPVHHQLIGRDPLRVSGLAECGSGDESRLLAALAAIALFAVVVAVPALAVHDDGIFQLDRNAVTTDPGDPATEGEDWDLVCPNDHVDGAAECLGGTTADTSPFIDDFPPANATIFTGGGSKDDLDIDSGPWLWKNGAVPDKDNLLHGFAARYDDHLYFGADRVGCQRGCGARRLVLPELRGSARRGRYTALHRRAPRR